MTFDIGFFIGILIYLVFFVIIYLYSKRTRKKEGESNNEKDDALKYILGALVLALCWLIFAPVWFPELYNKQFDIYRILILMTTITAIIAAYRLYVIKYKHI